MQMTFETLPASWYTDPAHYQIEREAIFSKEWIYVAEEVDFNQPGDYVSFTLAGYPVALVKGVDLKIRGFHNLCRHRGAPIFFEKKGSSASLTCKYHGWTYSDQGELVQAPYFDTKKLKSSCDVSLLKIQVGILDGLIFVNLDQSPRDFDLEKAAIKTEIKDSNYSLTTGLQQRQMCVTGDFNWKVWLDGFQECYHCPTVHPILCRDFDLKAYQIENKDQYAVHSTRRKQASSMGAFEGFWMWSYPNLGLPCYEPCFYTLQVNPLSVDQTQLTYRFHFKNHVTPIEQDEFIKMVELITQEDRSICEKVQINLKAGVFHKGLLNPERENGVQYFHSLIRSSIERHKVNANLT